MIADDNNITMNDDTTTTNGTITTRIRNMMRLKTLLESTVLPHPPMQTQENRGIILFTQPEKTS